MKPFLRGSRGALVGETSEDVAEMADAVLEGEAVVEKDAARVGAAAADVGRSKGGVQLVVRQTENPKPWSLKHIWNKQEKKKNQCGCLSAGCYDTRKDARRVI